MSRRFARLIATEPEDTGMNEAVVHVCTHCRHPDYKARRQGKPGGEALPEALKTALEEQGLDHIFKIEPITCLGNCKKRCRLSVVAPGRWSWLIGDLSPQDDFIELMDFLRAWQAAENGLIPKEERSKWLLRHGLGRVPPVIIGGSK